MGHLSPGCEGVLRELRPTDPLSRSDGQERIIDELLQNPSIAQRWEAACRDLYALVHFIKQSGRYRMFAPGNLGKGDFNVYRMFVESALSLTRLGRLGIPDRARRAVQRRQLHGDTSSPL